MTEPTPAPASVDEALVQRVAAAIYDTYGQQDRDRSNRIAAAVLAELAPELAELADYRNRITWETTCWSCSRTLDAAYTETARREQATAALTEILAEVRTLTDADTRQPIYVPGHITDAQYQRWQRIAHGQEPTS